MKKIVCSLLLFGSFPLLGHAEGFNGSFGDFMTLGGVLGFLAFLFFLVWGLILFINGNKQNGKEKLKYSLLSFSAMFVFLTIAGSTGALDDNTTNKPDKNIKVIYQLSNDPSTEIQLNKDGTARLRSAGIEIQTSWDDKLLDYISLENQKYGVIKDGYFYDTSNDAKAKRNGVKLIKIQ